MEPPSSYVPTPPRMVGPLPRVCEVTVDEDCRPLLIGDVVYPPERDDALKVYLGEVRRYPERVELAFEDYTEAWQDSLQSQARVWASKQTIADVDATIKDRGMWHSWEVYLLGAVLIPATLGAGIALGFGAAKLADIVD